MIAVLIATVVGSILGAATGYHHKNNTKYLVPLLILDIIAVIGWLGYNIMFVFKF